MFNNFKTQYSEFGIATQTGTDPDPNPNPTIFWEVLNYFFKEFWNIIVNWLFNNKHRGKRLQRCQQGRPSTFVPINVHSYLWRMYCVTLYSCWECTHFVEIKYVQWNLWNTKVSEHIVKDNNSSSLSWSWYVLWHGVRRNRTQNLYTPETKETRRGKSTHVQLGVTVNIDGYKRGRTTLLTSL